MGMYIQWVNGTWPGLPRWETSDWALGAELIDPAGHIQKAITAGHSGMVIPNFNDSGGTTVDGSVVWQDEGYNPSPVGPVSVAFNFYFRVRFASDLQDFEKWAGTGPASAFPPAGQGGGIWTVGGGRSRRTEPEH